MQFISSEKPKTLSSAINVRFAIGNLLPAKAGWKSKKDLIVPPAANRCTFTCALILTSVSGVRIIHYARLFKNLKRMMLWFMNFLILETARIKKSNSIR
jgi:hypothetical protein